MTILESCLIWYEISKYDATAALILGVQFLLGVSVINLLGSEEQKNRILPDANNFKKFISFGLTEPLKGSEAVNIDTTASKVEGGYLINGKKRWIGNSTFADYIIVWA